LITTGGTAAVTETTEVTLFVEGLTSGRSDVTVAVVDKVPVAVGFKTRVMTAEAPGASDPIAEVSVLFAVEVDPYVTEELTIVAPEGSGAVRFTFVAVVVVDPFVTVNVTATGAPTVAEVGVLSVVTRISTPCTTEVVTVAVLLAWLVSVSVAVVFAMYVRVVIVGATIVIVIVAVWPTARVPRDAVTVEPV